MHLSTTAIIGILVVIILILGGIFFLGDKEVAEDAPEGETGDMVSDENELGAGVEADVDISGDMIEDIIVTYTDDGYSPAEITIQLGQTVRFINQSSGDMWPASAVHPTHEVYDGTTLREHCVDGASDTFDACRGIAVGESYAFTFDKQGTWRYHDHLDASEFGSITVQ